METDSVGRPLLTQFSEEGFVDCVFRIENLAETPRTYRFHLGASHEGAELGFDVEVVKNIQGGLDGDMKLLEEHVYRKGVTFYRSGPDSDRLLYRLAALYQLDPVDRTMQQSEPYTAIALHQGPLDMANEPVKLKIFGRDKDTDSEDEYNESFFNLDLSNGFVYWNEKDPDYREPLITALSKPNGA